ncbi:tRNA (adenosine(37)-N6)-dimethylallyltransferase MiaA [Moraxella nasibovis]|uniref:tRNA (adenosine(37)-N6)-dimethylallyltransferase MiaA n=1 Tax=Moraxella nasibovis TaxID=2904120 RepID=UPI0024108B78|nr:tRNA (adenosine(37)-N6)-dimethylallyltransferase MiaA [Moraxella nasibovis]WFF39616.1 tRNA (adenosine(37)-N6)-dimethylallyltransferase MiaA [Moraxella nasibovis]
MLNDKKLNYKHLPDNAVVCLIAPTASGKTDLAFKLYDTGRFELVSVDSALIYQDMNIGTAKPTPSELERFPHHLVDIIEPTQTYNVASFASDTERLIDSIHQRGKIPLLVGGTMMYYMALLDGLSAVPDTDPAIREQVMAWLDQKGIGELYAYLQTHDPKICQRLKISDTQRITRAVEVQLQTGTPMSVWQATPKVAPAQNPSQHWIGLSVEPERAWLHERIERRLDIMWEHGFVDEVVNLLKKYPDLTPQMPSMRCVGYRQVLEFLALSGHEVMDISAAWQDFAKNLQKESPNSVQMACQDMKNKALYATRQLAKRQSTWQRSLARLDGTISSLIVPFSSIQEVQEQLL